MLIGCKPLCLNALCYAKQVIWIYLILLYSLTYHVLSNSFFFFLSFRRSGRISYFCSNNGPCPNVIFSALYQNSLLNWISKFKDMTEWFRNCRFFRKIFWNYPSKIKNYRIRKLSPHDLRWENVLFWGWRKTC